eukprot:5488980-Alexandrium_andersonii.AAC.1
MRVRIHTPCLGQDNRDARYFHERVTRKMLIAAWIEAGMREEGQMREGPRWGSDNPEENYERWDPNPDLIVPTGVG